MGGLWVDYNLMSTIPGLHVLGEANFSDHGANRLGASALMQGLADGYFVIPYTLAHYLGSSTFAGGHDRARRASRRRQPPSRRGSISCSRVKGSKTPRQLHRELGALLWDEVGMARNEQGLRQRAERIPQLREEFWQNVSVPGPGEQSQQEPRIRRPRRRLPRVRRSAGARRAAAHRVLRRPLPRGKPDARRRSAARRRPLSRTSPPGSSRASASRRPCTRSR